MIEQAQIEQFQRDGFLVVEGVLSPEEVAALQHDFDQWVEESRSHAQGWGATADGRERFDLEGDHRADHPSLRRVSSPTEISAAYERVALHSRMAAISAQLIGAHGTRFHHSKINSKLPHTATQVKWHQDFLFTPHSNDDIVTALLMVSEVTPQNGPLNVIPGSHKGPLWSLAAPAFYRLGGRRCRRRTLPATGGLLRPCGLSVLYAHPSFACFQP